MRVFRSSDACLGLCFIYRGESHGVDIDRTYMKEETEPVIVSARNEENRNDKAS